MVPIPQSQGTDGHRWDRTARRSRKAPAHCSALDDQRDHWQEDVIKMLLGALGPALRPES
jgi:hypothetical protein